MFFLRFGLSDGEGRRGALRPGRAKRASCRLEPGQVSTLWRSDLLPRAGVSRSALHRCFVLTAGKARHASDGALPSRSVRRGPVRGALAPFTLARFAARLGHGPGLRLMGRIAAAGDSLRGATAVPSARRRARGRREREARAVSRFPGSQGWLRRSQNRGFRAEGRCGDYAFGITLHQTKVNPKNTRLHD
jgi:hypothetical protein